MPRPKGRKYFPKRGSLMVDNEAISSRMWMRKVSTTQLAEAVGCTESSIRNKLAAGSWTLEEAYRVSRYLGLDLVGTFFAHPENVYLYVSEAPVVPMFPKDREDTEDDHGEDS